jgi:hypothetical protein
MIILKIKIRFPIFVFKAEIMNKVFIFAVFLLTMASCQKEVIIPNDETTVMELKDGVSSSADVPTTVTTTTTTAPTEPVVPTEDPGDITDPMRKKDKKDS